jgi:16S rRNA A1518/A1519 N6-dimethyltransferase RsmA/KsgA/DIM1 with predicted DNA glycosylase/AP lyase activity
MSRRDGRPAEGRLLSQHLLRDETVAQRIVAASGLAPPDAVYEIGPGSGLLTAALARRVNRVVAVEHDRTLIAPLRTRFADWPNVEIVHDDFLRYALPKNGLLKVAGNPPFSLTSPLIRHLLSLSNPPAEAVLVVQAEAALRWAGAVRESVVSIVAKARFTFEVRLALHRREFSPRPSVDCALLALVRRPAPLLDAVTEGHFGDFVAVGFGRGRSSARKNLERVVTYEQFKTVATRACLPLDSAPGELSLDDWLALFWLSARPAR